MKSVRLVTKPVSFDLSITLNEYDNIHFGVTIFFIYNTLLILSSFATNSKNTIDDDLYHR